MTRLGLPHTPEPVLVPGKFQYFRYMPAVWNLLKDMLNDIQYATNTNEEQKLSALKIMNLMYYAERTRFGDDVIVGDDISPVVGNGTSTSG